MRPHRPVSGVQAPPPRPTFAGALWLAGVISVPVFILASAGEILWRLLSG